ncbi:RNA polymerase factor sigma-70 [Azoarcus sp. KH32C]|uniref:RNA polymerase factor sigma-70 n=1 Tax=Azoarcus sp. KH32C TaxID=748247 RepID=UPI00023868FC|nr:RNA polymerase factor sigma-70 [Azoarcus sp. KH32C]BAL23207.1 ECF subfamily RNA polymerase, sigma-24 subunit [Azoarcus sp. KH32C]
MRDLALPAESSGAAAGDDDLHDDAFVESLRRQMLRFATLQLSDRDLAEDAVQEALVGALRNAASFSRRSALRTWVFAILRNKIADILRHKERVVDAGSLRRDDDEEDEDFSALFDQRGYWQADSHPAAWGNPQESLREQQFWRIFEICLDGLPPGQARVFMMREFIELESNEICAAAGVTMSNLNVMLYRARMRLRECLELRWFANGERPC